MAAPKGNQFWMLRSKHGRDKLFATPEASTNGRSASKNDYLKALQYEFTLPLPNNRKWDLDKEIIPIFKTL